MIQGDIAEGYKKAQKEDNPLSKKIIEKLAIKEIAEGLVNFFLKAQSQREEESVEEEPIKEEMINLGEEPEMTTHALFRGGKVANLNILERRLPKRESRNSGMELINLAKIIKRASSRFKWLFIDYFIYITDSHFKIELVNEDITCVRNL